MPLHKRVHVLGLVGEDGLRTEPLWMYLRSTRSIELDVRRLASPLEHSGAYQVLVVDDPTRLSADAQERLAAYVRRGGGCLALAVAATDPLPPLFGARSGPAGPLAELLLSFAD